MRSLLLVGILLLPACIYSIDGSLVDPDQGADGATDLASDGPPVDSTCDGDCAQALLGRLCNGGTPCPMGLRCAYPAGGTEGYCTFLCQNQGTLCDGGPNGTLYACALDAGEEDFCVFFCATAGAAYPCPNGLVCALDEQPAGSGQRICVPPTSR